MSIHLISFKSIFRALKYTFTSITKTNLKTFGCIIAEIQLFEVSSFKKRVPRYLNTALTKINFKIGLRHAHGIYLESLHPEFQPIWTIPSRDIVAPVNQLGVQRKTLRKLDSSLCAWQNFQPKSSVTYFNHEISS